MRKSILLMLLLLTAGMTANAQKFALIDMEYILKNIPAYERANEQLAQSSQVWQSEVEKISEEAKTMYKEYQSKIATLSEEQRGKREEAIVAKEKSAADLRRQYFGPEGELYKKRESLMKLSKTRYTMPSRKLPLKKDMQLWLTEPLRQASFLPLQALTSAMKCLLN